MILSILFQYLLLHNVPGLLMTPDNLIFLYFLSYMYSNEDNDCILFKPDTDLRQRSLKGGSGEDSDIDSLLQHHNRIQERLAEEMLVHAKALKQNVTDAGRVVREDVKVIHSHYIRILHILRNTSFSSATYFSDCSCSSRMAEWLRRLTLDQKV